MKFFIITLIASFTLCAFSTELIGKKLQYSYENGNIYEISFSTASELTWKATAGEETGTSGNETYQLVEIAKHIYQIGWVEQSGFAVTQVINLNTNSVNSIFVYSVNACEKPKMTTGHGKITEL